MPKPNRTAPNALNLTDHERQEIDRHLRDGKPSLPPQTAEQTGESHSKKALQAQITLTRPTSEQQSRSWYNGLIQNPYPTMPPAKPARTAYADRLTARPAAVESGADLASKEL